MFRRLTCLIVITLGIIPALMQADSGIVKIGLTSSLTGKWKRPGQEQLNGIRMWADQLNKRGGLLGKQIALVVYDDESDSRLTGKYYEVLINEDKVDLLLGPYSSTTTLIASNIAEKNNFPMLTIGASSTKIWSRGLKNVFGLYTPSKQYMIQILKYAKTQNANNLAIIFGHEEFPTNIAKSIRQTAKELGLVVVFDRQYRNAEYEFLEITPSLAKQDIDTYVLASYLSDSIRFIQSAADHKLKGKIFALAVGPSFPDFGVKLGPIANGVMGNSQWQATLKNKSALEFSQHYRNRFGYIPGYHAAGGYAAGEILEQAVNKSRSLDKNMLRRNLLTMDTSSILGRYKVDANGMQIGKKVYVVQWINGERRIIFPEDIADTKPLYPFPKWGD